mgnify:CR=1 FL=1
MNVPVKDSRTALLLGEEGVNALKNAYVAVFGIGGVGGYTAEALARSGVGHMDLVDDDTVSLTNLNRQLLATHSTVGQHKVDVARQRILDIDPTIQVRTFKTFYLPETADQFDFSQYDYVIDAIDTVTGKLALVAAAKAADTPIICAMGAGNKLDPTAFQVADIYETSVCPLARIMRKECRKRGIEKLKVVYSEEIPRTPAPPEGHAEGRIPPASTIFAPAAAGLAIAAEVVKEIKKACGAGFPLEVRISGSECYDGGYGIDCAQDTAAQMDKAVKEILDKCYADAVEILKENREDMDKVVAYLMEKETITGGEMVAIIEGRDPATAEDHYFSNNPDRPEGIEAPAKKVHMISQKIEMPPLEEETPAEEEDAEEVTPPAESPKKRGRKKKN